MTITTPQPIPCPRCGTPNRGLVNIVGDNAPRDGDLSVCVMCTAVLVLENNVTAAREATDAELIALPLKVQAQLILARMFLKSEGAAPWRNPVKH